jgi:hypothetical protein
MGTIKSQDRLLAAPALESFVDRVTRQIPLDVGPASEMQHATQARLLALATKEQKRLKIGALFVIRLAMTVWPQGSMAVLRANARTAISGMGLSASHVGQLVSTVGIR